MAKDRLSRKLAVILHADVAGSTALVKQNEQIAHERIQAAFRRFGVTITRYQGHVRELRGDALLAEFERASDALTAALVFQVEQLQYLAQLGDSIQPLLRAGIAMGEVIIADDTITGEGVVLAQRLEQLSKPGGVVIQGAAYETIPGRFSFEYEDLGEHEVKGFDKPVRAYSANLKSGADLPQPGPRTYRSRNSKVTIATVAIVITAMSLVWFEPWEVREEPASVELMAFPLPDKPSIAVLPFTNMSGDAEQEYFADGMTEDLITDLSKISSLFVIARNSTFTYKGKPVKVRQIAEELGVRYVFEGSVRRAGNQVRINAQLVDATTGGHVWAERYDSSMNDVFAVQDEVTQKIVAALALNLNPEEKTRQARTETDNPQAYDSFLRGWAHYRRNTPDDFAKAVPYLEKAIELDANYSRAYAVLAAVYWSVVDKDRSTGTTSWSWALGINTEESRRREHLNLEAAMKNPTPLAYQVASGRLVRQGQHEAAIVEAGRAIALDPNDPVAHEAMATALIYAGKPVEASRQIKLAMRFDPRFPHEYLYWLGLAQFGMERFEEAAETLTRATHSNPDDDRSLILLAAAYGHLERAQEAKSAVEKANRLRHERQQRLTDPELQMGIDVFLAGPYTLKDADLWPFQERADRERLYQGLRLAGVPEAGHGNEVSPTQVAGATTVDATAAKSLLDRGALFVDVRGDESWNNGHIPGAVHLYLKTDFSEAALSAVVARDKEIVIYCMGPRCLLSSVACAEAVTWGFEKIYYFREGFPSWKAAGYPVEVPQV